MRTICGTILAAAIGAAVPLVATAQGEDFAKWVDPFIGTSGDGNCFPGPCRPFGMVQPSPDTGEKTYCGGYKFTDTTIRHFSQTHLNGTGRPAMGDIGILPFFSTGLTGLTRLSGGVPPDPRNPVNLVNPVKKETEIAEVGYYAVTLENGIKCEATATERVAVWRFTWPEGAARALSVDAAAMLMQRWNQKLGATVPESSATLREDNRGISGCKKALGWTPYKLFYAIKFSEPWAKIEKLPSDPFQGKGDRWIIEFGDSLTPNCSDGSTNVSPFKNAGALAEASDKSELNQLEVRIALSTVSEDGTEKNMRAEADGKSFEQIRAECRAEWNALLSRAQLVKGTDDQKKNWYTALYHLCIQPNIQTDVDGKYRGADDAIHTAKRGHYSTFSLWDTFRAAHPLYTILVPERVPGFVDSLVAFGEQHGHLPMWTMWQGEDHCMVGIHSIPVIVDAWKKGLVNKQNLSTSQLLTLMVQSMINNDGENPKNCWNAYWENGYIPYFAGEFDKHLSKGQSVSTTLELAYDWWCIADFARQIGDERSAAKAQKWADCWKNVFDAEIGFARPRAPKTAGGAWREPFDPADPRAGGIFWSDFTEANSWIYTWHVFQDPDTLSAALGGRDKALAKLDEFFVTMPKGKGGSSDEGGLAADGNLRRGQIGMYWHGNEPSHHIAYLYSLWGRREKTAALVGRICREAYRPAPDGLCGNDDCGQMSAWYIFSMMGFYPANPCGDGYVLGEAQAEEIKLRVGSEEFRILALKNNKKCANVEVSNSQQPISNVFLNGEAIKGVKISHEDIMRGRTLEFGGQLLAMDMVHHNPGDKPTESRFLDPAYLSEMGSDAKVVNDFRYPQCACTFEDFDAEIFPAGSPERKWVEDFTAEVEAKARDCHGKGLECHYFMDIIVLPRRLIEKYRSEICGEDGRVSFEREKTWEIHRLMVREMLRRIPSVDGYVIRTGEMYSHNVPYHGGNTPHDFRKPLDGFVETHAKLMNLLREEICVKGGKKVFYRTWDFRRFHIRPDLYLAITDQVEPHDKLFLSVKHTAGDYLRFVPFNPTLGIGKHKQIVEVQCQREYEGKGAYPNYVVKGVVEGFEENAESPGIQGLGEFLKDSRFAGVWTWSRGGGWEGPYLKNELWCAMNAFVMTEWAKNPEAGEEAAFGKFMDRIGVAAESREAFRRLAVLSAEAVVRGMGYMPDEKLTACWTRDHFIGGFGVRELDADANRLVKEGKVGASIANRRAAVERWREIVRLADSVRIADKDAESYVRVSSRYGLHLYRIYEAGWTVMLLMRQRELTGKTDEKGIAAAVKRYDEAWRDYRALASDPQCATLFDGHFAKYRISQDHNSIDSVPGMDAEVDKAR